MANILITGATGLAGNRALNTALADPEVGQVTIIIRRELASDPVRAPYASKLRTLVVPDTGKLDWDRLATEVWWGVLDGCIWALGQPFYKSSLTLPEYERMIVDWPYACASRLPKSSNFVFITGATATQEENAWWTADTRNMKGRAEKKVLGIENGPTVVILRPGGILEPNGFNNVAHWLLPGITVLNEELAQVAVAATKKGIIEGRKIWWSKDISMFAK